MLQLYINQLSAVEQSKPYVRVIVAIIDAFHFDLKNCDFKATEFVMAKNPKKDKRHLGSALKRLNFQKKEEKMPMIEDEGSDQEVVMAGIENLHICECCKFFLLVNLFLRVLRFLFDAIKRLRSSASSRHCFSLSKIIKFSFLVKKEQFSRWKQNSGPENDP